MALPSTVYKASIQLSDVDRGVYESLQATVARHPSETEERLVARLLAFAIFHEPELTFTKGICAAVTPFYPQVGLPEADRIIRASRHSERVALLAYGRALAGWDQQNLPKLEKIANLTVISIDQGLINRLAAQLERSINWSITITEGTFYLTIGEESMEAAIQLKRGSL